MAAAIVAVNLVLLSTVMLAAVYGSYKPDEWFIRLLAGGLLTSVIGILAAIAAHYWPRSDDKKR